MVAKVGGPVRYLADSAFRSESVLYAEAMRSLASRTALAQELSSGAAAGSRPIAGYNPQGTLGIDLSGPPWGSAILHPVATAGGRNTTSGTTGERHVVEGIYDTEKVVGPWMFWNRPHARLPYPSVAPYSRLFLGFTAYLASGGNQTLTIRFITVDPETDEPIDENEEDFTISTTETAFLSSTGYFGGLRGGTQAVRIGFVHTGTVQAFITSMSIFQMVKRSH
jgi:hypothetical protein